MDLEAENLELGGVQNWTNYYLFIFRSRWSIISPEVGQNETQNACFCMYWTWMQVTIAILFQTGWEMEFKDKDQYL